MAAISSSDSVLSVLSSYARISPTGLNIASEKKSIKIFADSWGHKLVIDTEFNQLERIWHRISFWYSSFSAFLSAASYIFNLRLAARFCMAYHRDWQTVPIQCTSISWSGRRIRHQKPGRIIRPAFTFWQDASADMVRIYFYDYLSFTARKNVIVMRNSHCNRK